MKYNVDIITRKQKDEILSHVRLNDVYQLKADIHGTCVKLFTDNPNFRQMWLDNFKPMLDTIRPHVRVYAVSGSRDSRNPKGKKSIQYEPNTKTLIIQNWDYYGLIKSVALSIVNEYFEDVPSEHRRYSVHGSCIDYKGKAIGFIGTSGAGKTTLTYGLMLDKGFNFITDDWFFVRMEREYIRAFQSERNSYLRNGLEKDWPKYKNKISRDGRNKDKYGRFIVDVKTVFGDGRVLSESNLNTVVLLTRNKRLPPFIKINQKSAIRFMLENGFCNPHYLTRNNVKMNMRKKFFLELFSRVPVYLLNTIETPKQSLARLKKIVKELE